MASIELKNAEKWFGQDQVIKGINLTIKKGEFVVFVGPSGVAPLTDLSGACPKMHPISGRGQPHQLLQ